MQEWALKQGLLRTAEPVCVKLQGLLRIAVQKSVLKEGLLRIAEP